jgi:cation:H+ antiporter
MFLNLLIILALLTLFYFLGKSADLVITHVKILADRLGIRLFFIGIILGLITTLPEMAVGINAIMSGLPKIALGNLLGGIMILLGLILGVSLILNRGIETDGKIRNFLPIILYLFLPMILCLDGLLNFLDGIFIIIAYFGVTYYFYLSQKHLSVHVDIEVAEKKALKSLFLIILGIVAIIVLSDVIMRATQIILAQLAIPTFILGLLIFAVGTNLPEITLALKSWQRKVKELSMSNLLGSAMANMLVLGLFACFREIAVELNFSFYVFIGLLGLLFGLLVYFYKTNKELSRKEGMVLLSIYALFVVLEIIFWLSAA